MKLLTSADEEHTFQTQHSSSSISIVVVVVVVVVVVYLHDNNKSVTGMNTMLNLHHADKALT